MPSFRYQAYDNQGALRSGEINAQSVSIALEQLHATGIVPFQIGPDVKAARQAWWNTEIKLGRELSTAALTGFTRELATLLEADIPIDEALQGIVRKNGTRSVDRFVRRLLDRIRSGQALSEALHNEGTLVPDYYVSLIRAGETSGRLAENMQQLATLLERLGDIKGKLLSALVYPAILLGMALITMSVLVTVLIPELMPIFESARAEPPRFFTFVITAKALIVENWPAAFALVTVSVALAALVWRREATKALFDRMILRMPVVGAFVVRVETARLTRTLGAMLSNGVTLLHALEISSRLLKNRMLQAVLADITQRVREGATFAEECARAGQFPDVAIRLIGVGERSGRLAEMLLHTARILESETERHVDRLMSILAPVLTLVLGLGVGLLVISVMNAILSVNQLAI